MRAGEIKTAVKNFDGFVGGPKGAFLEVALATFYTLSILGLRPEHKLLDIGCGALRNGVFLLNYLNTGNYFGVEPNAEMLQAGVDLFADAPVREKSPTFSHDDQFRFGQEFPGAQFDFAVARSVFTHASRSQMSLCLSELRQVMPQDALFLLSYSPPKNGEPEYGVDQWIGRSHESDLSGMANYHEDTIVDIAAGHGFAPLRGLHDKILQTKQEWLILKRLGD